MFYCEKCNSTECCERTDLPGEPVLCDNCYGTAIYGIDCEKCTNSYFDENDRLRCTKEACHPNYNV